MNGTKIHNKNIKKVAQKGKARTGQLNLYLKEIKLHTYRVKSGSYNAWFSFRFFIKTMLFL